MKTKKIKKKTQDSKKTLSLQRKYDRLQNKYTKLLSTYNYINDEYLKIVNSKGWKLVTFLRNLIKSLFKPFFFSFTILKKLLKKILSIGLVIQILKKLKTFKKLLIFRIEKVLTLKKRNINFKSKKILYVDHSFHIKSRSTVFLINLLKKEFNIEVLWDESWNGEPFPDLSFVDNSYLAVVFFQNLPPVEDYNKIKNDNLICFPMYDSGVMPFEYWKSYKNLKIINFSSTLHKILNFWGFDSMYIQRFIKPKKFIPGDKDSVFFYCRYEYLNINTVKKLFKHSKIKLHIHKTIDPGMKFVQPTKTDEKRFSITYTDWFEKKADKWRVANKMALFISPREFEGIGQGYLEAMASGRAVIAVDNPTMNEYIVHNKTGYLFNLRNPKPLDISNVEQVQRNTYEYMTNGYNQWKKEKYKIIDFIKKR